ncbi:hypothetical protein Pan44_32370 [Caulifigura coniformis]|uniref:Uncharacterized protein n=2 Tax=Caulifigura coniformis TaxID=2527983 RepID=A0A517SGC9_9PLAN|nr:hypothetical protein Pan44_32370 [Caulifigura coniformis]
MTMPGTDEARRPVVTNAIIFVSAGVLIALAELGLINQTLTPYVVACGLVGILASVGLSATRKRREQELAIAREDEAIRRLSRHLTPPQAPPLPLEFGGDPVAELFAAPPEPARKLP